MVDYIVLFCLILLGLIGFLGVYCCPYQLLMPRILLSIDEIDQYLWMVGGSAGALALTGVAAASAFYLSTRPKPEKPLVTLHEQSLLEAVSFHMPPIENKY